MSVLVSIAEASAFEIVEISYQRVYEAEEWLTERGLPFVSRRCEAQSAVVRAANWKCIPPGWIVYDDWHTGFYFSYRFLRKQDAALFKMFFGADGWSE
jgi:hypothetical protein